MRQLAVLLALSLLLSSAQAAGKTYRWVDEKGRAHYGDVRTKDSEAVHVGPGSGNGSGSADAAAGATAAASAETERQANCQRLRDQVDAYSKAATVNETDALGRVHSYSEADKQKLVERTREQMNKACEPRALPTSPTARPRPAGGNS